MSLPREREVLAMVRLELAEVLRSRWLLFCCGVYALLAAMFVLVGLRESSVFGFTGMGRVLLGFCHALVLVLPLLGLSATGQVVNRRGTTARWSSSSATRSHATATTWRWPWCATWPCWGPCWCCCCCWC